MRLFLFFMLSFLTTIKNEILSYFVPEKMEYKITGECKKCGKCCRYMYSFDTYTTTDFKIMQFFFPAYRRFYIRGKNEEEFGVRFPDMSEVYDKQEVKRMKQESALPEVKI